MLSERWEKNHRASPITVQNHVIRTPIIRKII